MAYLPNYSPFGDEEEDPRKKVGQLPSGDATSPQYMHAYGMSPRPGGSAIPSSIPGAPTENQGGEQGTGAFVPFQRYLDQNKTTSDRMSNDLAQGVDKSASDASHEVWKAQNSNADAVNAGTLKYEAPKTAAEAKSKSTLGYTGPSSMSGAMGAKAYGDLMSKTSDANTKLRLLGGDSSTLNADEGLVNKYGTFGSSGGVEALLRDKYKNSPYTHGESRFDAGLTNSVGRDRFDELRGRYGDLEDYLKQADKGSADYATGAKDASGRVAGMYGQDATALGQYEAGLSADNKNVGISTPLPRANAGHGNLSQSTVSMSDDRIAQSEGGFADWKKYCAEHGEISYSDWKKLTGFKGY
jgi:hypothetical protein